jgi:Flp pilus assembly protein TadG
MMTIKSAVLRAIPRARLVRKFLRSRRGNIAPMVALLIIPLGALMGLATQGGAWFLTQRAMQNAADSAAIAAATNGGNGGTDYVAEATSITANYGFTNGSGSVTVSVPAPTTYGGVTSCASSPCYNVVINKVAPLYLLQLIGYTGNSSGGGGQNLVAGALATTMNIQAPFCLLGLGTTGTSISTNGNPAANLGCNIFSNSNSKCNGHPITTGFSDSGPSGSQTGSADCGGGHHDNQPAITDPYSGTAITNQIVADIAGAGGGNHCTGSPNTYYPESSSSWPSGTNLLSGAMTLPAVSVYCGDVSLGGNVQITSASPGSVIIIENGMLDLHNYLMQSLAGSGVTIIFYSPQGSAEAYTSGGTPTNFVCATPGCGPGSANGSILDISSPTSGEWSGYALFQDMNLPLQGSTNCTGNDKWAYSGSSPTWNISGIVDFNRTDFCVSGAINKATNGFTCLTIVDNTTHVNGTGNIFYTNPQSQCAQQGVTQIMANAYVIGKLVY